VALVAFVMAAPAWADQHIADNTAMSQAIAARQATDAANRAVVEKALDRPDVQDAAKRFGLDVGTAKSALESLSSDQLAQLAGPASTVVAVPADDLSGGSSVVTISVTTLLLLLILIVLIVR
jgi:hypothetical protein